MKGVEKGRDIETNYYLERYGRYVERNHKIYSDYSQINTFMTMVMMITVMLAVMVVIEVVVFVEVAVVVD